MSEELMPCPVCGGDTYWDAYIYCLDDGCPMSRVSLDHEQYTKLSRAVKIAEAAEKYVDEMLNGDDVETGFDVLEKAVRDGK